MVYGVGIIGEGKYKATVNRKPTKEYTAWRMMIRRCYDKSLHEKFPTYINCTCDKKWLNFQNFCKDIVSIEGYNEWKLGKTKYHLDKDCKIKGNKHYSKYTCMFVTENKNVTENSTTGLVYKIKNIDTKEEKEFVNQSLISREMNWNSRGLNLMLTGRRNTYKRWVLVSTR